MVKLFYKMFKFFTKTRINPKRAERKKRRRAFLSKLSGSFFIAIALMPLAGILLGVGSAITANSTSILLSTFGTIINSSGSFFFNNLGLFFAVSIVIGFTKDWKAIMSVIWGYFIFISFQSGFLVNSHIDFDNTNGFFNIWFLKHIPISIIASNLGIISLNTGVVGGLLVSWIVIMCYKRWKNVKLPSFLSFFDGSRAVPFIVSFFMFYLSFAIMIIWPFIGICLNKLGSIVSAAPNGVSAGIYTWIFNSLTPFGVHHAFYTLFWFTSVGGTLDPQNTYINAGNNHFETLEQYIRDHYHGSANLNFKAWIGDTNIWFNLEKYNINFNTVFYRDQGHHIIHLNPGQFLGIGYPVMIGGALGSYFAILYRTPKEKRKKIAFIMGSAIITSMGIGVTEPWLWSFLVIAPFLYFGFSTIMMGIGAALMAYFNCHIGSAFSCGILDWIIYGALPFKNGTRPFIVFAMCIVYVPIYFVVFYFYMKFRKIYFPIIYDDKIIGDKKKTRSQWNIDQLVLDIVNGIGGKENIVDIFNCATRLRCNVKDANLVKEKILLASGAYKVLIFGKNIQIIYGPKAERITNQVNDYLKKNTNE